MRISALKNTVGNYRQIEQTATENIIFVYVNILFITNAMICI
jgi:hypothetical protein